MCANIATKSNDILVLFGSPHRNGYTHYALDKLLGYVPEPSNVHLVSAYDLNINPCTGCGACQKESSCIYNKDDDFQELDQLINAADIIILASPIYFNGFPAPLKVIIDRFQQYYEKRRYPVFYKKRGLLLLTCGSPDSFQSSDSIKNAVEIAFRSINTKLYGCVLVRNTDLTPQNNMSNREQKQLVASLFLP